MPSGSKQLPEIRPDDSHKWKTGSGRPVIAIDIDGTLGDYHKHFLWFAQRWLGRPVPDASEINPGMRLSTFMGIPHHVYRECKLAYRQGGLKRWMPCYPFASVLTHELKNHGAEVWICTSRPYLRLDNIDPDTREWLRRNKIHYDAVIFESAWSENGSGLGKYPELVRQVGLDRVVAVVDDLPEQISGAMAAGIHRLYIRDQPYNNGLSPDFLRVTRVDNLLDLSDFLIKDLEHWARDRITPAG